MTMRYAHPTPENKRLLMFWLHYLVIKAIKRIKFDHRLQKIFLY